MRVAIAELRDHRFEGVEHVEIGAGIQVGGGESSGCVEDENMANAGPSMLLERVFEEIGKVNDFALLPGFYRESLHKVV
jgi:hypothetical protein